jgi:putative DNA primase/helicase
VVNSLLVREALADGSLLADPGYDARSELYLLPGFRPLTMPEHPTREQAVAALNLLTDLLSEFSFAGKIDTSVALSGLLTALHAHTPGTGKSYLVDVIAAVATGRECPVTGGGKTEEETEKRLGSMLLSADAIVSLDNCMHDLEGQLLCQLTERPLVKIRILGRSEMPECECHTTAFATGNNISFKGDMVRRGLRCNLDALIERPELREFKHDPLHQV